MKLLVVSYKTCRRDERSPSGYVADGGFPIQMRALSELFDATTLLMERDDGSPRAGDIPLVGHRVSVQPIAAPRTILGRRKIGLVLWTLWQLPTLLRAIRAHDAVHTPVPCDTGSIAMLLAWLLRKPLYVRHCGNWHETRTAAERFWKWFMERTAGGRNVMLATGGDAAPPSAANPAVHWIFSTTLGAEEMQRVAGRARETIGTPVRLALVGRQETGKGTDVLLQTVALLRERGVAVEAHVAGDGSAVPALQRLADEYSIRSAVVFHGKLSHEGVLEMLRDADLFCFPTVSEGFPKAVLEALASGLPVITTPVSVLPQLLADGAGILVPARTPEAFADAVQRCIREPAFYRAMSACALQTAARYTLEEYQHRLGTLLGASWGQLRHA